MDTTQDRESTGDQAQRDRLEALEAADPADAPAIAEKIADELTAALEAEDDEGRTP